MLLVLPVVPQTAAADSYYTMYAILLCLGFLLFSFPSSFFYERYIVSCVS